MKVYSPVIVPAALSHQSSTRLPLAERKNRPRERYLWRINEPAHQSEVVRDKSTVHSGQLDTAMAAWRSERKGSNLTAQRLFPAHAGVPGDVPEGFTKPIPTSVFSERSIGAHRVVWRIAADLYVAGTLDGAYETNGEAAVDSKFIADAFDVILNPPLGRGRTNVKFSSSRTRCLGPRAELVANGPAVKIKPESDPHLRARETCFTYC